MDKNNAPTLEILVSGQQIGDYLIGELLSKDQHTTTWSATQISVQREVAICSLHGTHHHTTEATEAFMADVRSKATVDHPLVSSVLEAVQEQGHCFYAREKLHGQSLQAHYEEGLSITPIHLASIMRNIAGTAQSIEQQNIATQPLTAHDIMIDDKLECRLVNQAVAGHPNTEVATQDKKLLGNLFLGMLTSGEPGATRTASLLDYMINGYEGQPLSWEQIHRLANEIEHQLSETKKSAKRNSSNTARKRSFYTAILAKIAIAIAIIAIAIGLTYYISNHKTVTPERELIDLVKIPNGQYPGPMGTPIKLQNFSIEAHEVTIGEYAKFLKAFSVITAEQRRIYQHPEQPPTKTDHTPEDWATLYNAATTGETWNTMPIDLNYPVVGVDWWDAYAYAEWKGRRLPTREEWYAACAAGADPTTLTGTGWIAVDQTEKTSHGIYAMAGNVSEWTLKRSYDSADPSQPARFIICGASYLKPKYGARAFEWVSDRNLRRADLGFRTCTNSSPEE